MRLLLKKNISSIWAKWGIGFSQERQNELKEDENGGRKRARAEKRLIQ